MISPQAKIQLCGRALYVLAALSSLLRVLLALLILYPYILGNTELVEWIQRWFPKMDRYSLDSVAVLAPMLLLFLCFWDCVTLWGAGHMQRLDSYGPARFALLPACLPLFSPCVILGLPFAWAIYSIMKDPQSQQFFAKSPITAA